MNETPANIIEPISNSANPVQNITPPIDAIPTSTALDGAPKKKNYFLWILGILVLVILLVVILLIFIGKSKSISSGSLTQSPAPQEQTTVTATDINTSSWKTYTNENVGFTFKYPANWKESDMSDLDWGIPTLSVTKLNQYTPYNSTAEMYADIRIVIYKNINKLTVDEFVKKEAFAYERKDKNFDYGDYKRGVPYEFNGLKTIKVSRVSAPPGQRGDVVFIPSKNNYIVGIEEISSFEENAKIFDKILSTFKFIDTATNKINLTLSTGWTKSVEQANNPFDETEKYERIVLVKGNYKIEIGDPVGGGRANCNAEKPIPSILNNPYLSSVVKRTNPEEPSEATNLQICSNLGFNNDLDYGTKIGFIKYFLPANWNQKILTEMDSIVESITLAK